MFKQGYSLDVIRENVKYLSELTSPDIALYLAVETGRDEFKRANPEAVNIPEYLVGKDVVNLVVGQNG